MTSGCVRLNYKQFIAERGLTADNHPVVRRIHEMETILGLKLSKQGPFLAGSSLLSIMSTRIADRVMNPRLVPDTSFGACAEHGLSPPMVTDSVVYVGDIDLFTKSQHQYQKILRRLMTLDRLDFEGHVLKKKTTTIPLIRQWWTLTKRWSLYFNKEHKGMLIYLNLFWNSNFRPKPQVNLKYNLVGFRRFRSVDKLLNDFDLNVCRIAYDGTDLIIAAEAMYDIGRNQVTLNPSMDLKKKNKRRLQVIGHRLDKYTERGFECFDAKAYVAIESALRPDDEPMDGEDYEF